MVRSSCQPEAAQKQRSSANFRLNPPAGYQHLKWTLQNVDNPANILFELWQDVKFSVEHPLSRDQQILSDVSHQAVTPRLDDQADYYLANPRGCSHAQDYFEVVIEAI